MAKVVCKKEQNSDAFNKGTECKVNAATKGRKREREREREKERGREIKREREKDRERERKRWVGKIHKRKGKRGQEKDIRMK
jgi:hypothetical protein